MIDRNALALTAPALGLAFVTTVKLVGGTRKYEGVTGQFVAPGVLELATGATVGSYTARICKPGDDGEDEDEN